MVVMIYVKINSVFIPFSINLASNGILSEYGFQNKSAVI